MISDRKAQMSAYDRFGPLTRAAIGDTPKDFDSVALLRKFDRPVAHGHIMRHPDLADPEMDKRIAEFVQSRCQEAFGLSFHGSLREKPGAFRLDARKRKRTNR